MVYTPGISENTAGVTTFYHMDAQGSVVATTSSAQTQTGDMRCDAFGNKSFYINSAGTFGWNAKSQYQTDADSGLMLLGNRYYDCSVGRFISQDPAQDESNWYSYCGNNPLVAVDPSGLETLKAGVSVNGILKDPSHIVGGSGDASLDLLFDTKSGDMGARLTLGIGGGYGGLTESRLGAGWSASGELGYSPQDMKTGVTTGESTGAFGGIFGAVGGSHDSKTGATAVTAGIGDGGGIYHDKQVTITVTASSVGRVIDKHVIAPVANAFNRFILQPFNEHVAQPVEAAAKQYALEHSNMSR